MALFNSLAERLSGESSLVFKPGVDAKGLAKVVIIVTDFLVKAYVALEKLFYGTPIPSQEFLKKTSIPKNPLKLGIIPILRILASVDFCNIIMYALQKASMLRFNPNRPPETTKPKFEKLKWDLQKAAYDSLQILEGRGEDYLYANNPDAQNRLFKAIIEVRPIIQGRLEKVITEPGAFFKSAEDQVLSNSFSVGNPAAIRPDVPILANSTGDIDALITVYPQLKMVRQTVKNCYNYFDRYTDFRQLDAASWAKVQKMVSLLKKALQIIVGLVTPQAFLADYIASGLLPGIAQQIAKVQLLVRPEKLIPFLQKLVKILTAIARVCQLILRIIKVIQLIITIVIILIKVLKIIIKFLQLNPIPSVFATEGVGDTLANVHGGIVWFLDKLERVLLQIAFFLALVVLVVRTVLLAIQECIYLINRIIANLRGCQYVGNNVIQDLVTGQNALTDVSDQFYFFLKNKENNDANDGIYDANLTPIDQLLAENLANLQKEFPPVTPVVSSQPAAATADAAAAEGVKPTPTPSVSKAATAESQTDNIPPYLDENTIRRTQGIPQEAIDKYIEEKIKRPQKNVTNPTSKIGEYTIKIVTEEVVEKTFGLKRRYGIAVNERDEIIVQSTPTYGSDSGIIIREVEQLLIGKNLIKKSPSLITPEEQNIIREVSSYLYNRDTIDWKNFPGLSTRMRSALGIDSKGERLPVDPTPKTKKTNKPSTGGTGTDVGQTNEANSTSPANESQLNSFLLGEDFDSSFADQSVPEGEIPDPELIDFNLPEIDIDKFNLEEFSLDPPDNEDENVELGLNAWINKLKGGRKLRRRMRRIFARKLEKFLQDTSREDPKNYTSTTAPQTGGGTNRLINSDQSIQSRSADFSDGEFLFQGIITKSYPGAITPRTIFSGQLRADDKELAKQKLLERYDPNDEKGYSYYVYPI